VNVLVMHISGTVSVSSHVLVWAKVCDLVDVGEV
jgi:hypothetical protein